MAGGEQQQSFQDFVGRYEQGAPHEGISDEEAAGRYGQVAGEVDPDTYQASARDALANMGPQEREQYAQQVGAAADEQGVNHGWDGQSTDPDSLAAMTTTVHPRNPGLLTSLLGGGGARLGGLLEGGAGAGGDPGGLGGLGRLGRLLGGAAQAPAAHSAVCSAAVRQAHKPAGTRS